MAIFDDILAFSETLGAWECDFLRRVFERQELTADDRSAALAALREQYGLPPGREVVFPVPLTAAHLPPPRSESERVVLNSLGDPLNVNRLATGQRLPFGVAGLTIVYGDNGSGKSGYCRLLKKLCRVRDGGVEEIKGNAFDPKASALQPEVTVRFTIGNSDVNEVRWRKGEAPPDALRLISVFDAGTCQRI